MSRIRKISLVDRNRCVACGECANTCPRGAIVIRNGQYAVVEEEKCVGCSLCSRCCPAGCIVMQEVVNHAKE